MTTLNKRLCELREERGLTIRQMSVESGIPESTIKQVSYYRVDVRATTLVDFADFFGVSMDYLFGRTDVREVARD